MVLVTAMTILITVFGFLCILGMLFSAFGVSFMEYQTYHQSIFQRTIAIFQMCLVMLVIIWLSSQLIIYLVEGNHG